MIDCSLPHNASAGGERDHDNDQNEYTIRKIDTEETENRASGEEHEATGPQGTR
jgi:hypothetical protein